MKQQSSDDKNYTEPKGIRNIKINNSQIINGNGNEWIWKEN